MKGGFITWFGGKSNLVKKLLQYVPQHKYYLEVFGGGAALLFAKEPSYFEVYNDIDGNLVNLFRVVRDDEKFKKFYKLVANTLHSRAEYDFARKKIENEQDEILRAYYFYILARQSFAGRLFSGWGHTVSTSGNPKLWHNGVRRLPEIHERLKYVQVEHLDWEKCLEKYLVNSSWNFGNAFVYLDPPYVPTTRRSGKYSHEMSVEDHERLVDWLLEHQSNAKFMLSGYPNEIYEKLENNGWTRICWEVSCNSAGRTRQTGLLGEGATKRHNQMRTECIWVNYQRMLK